MVDINSPRTPLTIQLPANLIAELQTVAKEKQCSVDEVVCEACLAYTEPLGWERVFQEWERANPARAEHEASRPGNALSAPKPEAKTA